MKSHLFEITEQVWLALSIEEVLATAADLKELGLYKMPVDGPIMLKLPWCSIHIRGEPKPSAAKDSWIEVLFSLAGIRTEACHDLSHWNDPQNLLVYLDRHGKELGIEPGEMRLAGSIARVQLSEGREFDAADLFFRDALITILASNGTHKTTKVNKLAKLGIGKAMHAYTTTISLAENLPTGDASEARPGNPLRAHLRRGHIRSQHHGAGNLLIKRIWIAPTFVNADEEFISTRKAYVFKA